jgi:hypothetical protein
MFSVNWNAKPETRAELGLTDSPESSTRDATQAAPGASPNALSQATAPVKKPSRSVLLRVIATLKKQ